MEHIIEEKLRPEGIVICDECNTDLTHDTRSGGFLFGSHAIGPCCAERMGESIIKHNEQSYIKAFCPSSKSFTDWVREDLRGGNSNEILFE